MNKCYLLPIMFLPFFIGSCGLKKDNPILEASLISTKDLENKNVIYYSITLKNNSQSDILYLDKTLPGYWVLGRGVNHLVIFAINDKNQKMLPCLRPGSGFDPRLFMQQKVLNKNSSIDLPLFPALKSYKTGDLIREFYCIKDSNKNYLKVEYIELNDTEMVSNFRKKILSSEYKVIYSSNLIEF